MSPLRAALVLASLCVTTPAWADRIAVLALESPTGPAPFVQADRVAAALGGQGHRIIAPADAAGRLSSGEAGVGADWAARQIQAIQTAMAALTRLDRHFAQTTERGIGREIVARGGGAGGSEVLVEWGLFRSQLASTAGDAAAARSLMDAAAAMGPTVELDPVRHPSDEADRFSRRKAAMLAQTPASVSWVTVPPAADLWVDGVRRCATPCTVKLVPGRHLALVTSPAHRPATVDFEVTPGAQTRRELALSAAYAGASGRAIASMYADPSRRNEAASALEPMARFLDVDHVVALIPEEPAGSWRILVSPPAAGRSRIGPVVSERSLESAVIEQLRATEVAQPSPSPSTPWYAKPGTWVAAGLGVAALVGTVLILNNTNQEQKGTLIVGSPP